MRRVAAFLVLLLLAPGMQAAWTQLGGDAQHAGIGAMPDRPLDVVAHYSFLEEGESISLLRGPGMVSTAGGIVGVVETSNGCDLVTLIDLVAGAVQRVPAEECTELPQLVGYDAISDTLLVCSRSTTNGDVLVALGLDGTVHWSLPAADLNENAGSAQLWRCSGPAIDHVNGVAYIPFIAFAGGDFFATAGQDHRIMAIQLDDGEVLWESRVSTSDVIVPNVPEIENELDDLKDTLNPLLPAGHPGFEPLAVTLTGGGLVIAADQSAAASVAFMDLDGKVTGFITAANTPLGRATDDAVSGSDTLDGVEATLLGVADGNAWAAARNHLGAMALGAQVRLLDAAAGEALTTAEPTLAGGFLPHGYRGPVAWSRSLVVPAQNGVVALDGDELQQIWSKLVSNRPGYSLVDLFLDPGRSVYLLESVPQQGSVLERLNLETGETLQRLVLPFDNAPAISPAGSSAVGGSPQVTGAMVPLTGIGVLIITAEGEAVLVQPTNLDDLVRIGLSREFPEIGEALAVTVEPWDAGTITRGIVYWGEGSSSPLGPDGTSEFRFVSEGPKTIRVALDLADGRTLTKEVEVDVGGEPPRLSWIQRAFAPENQDMTWGVIGLAFAVLGGLLTLLVSLFRRRRMGRELAELDTIRELAVEDPIVALQRLRAYRYHLRDRAKRGRMDDPPFGSLLQEVGKMFRVLQSRMLAAYDARLSAGTKHAMDAAFADGVLSTAEILDLKNRIGAEKALAAEERRSFLDLLDNWV